MLTPASQGEVHGRVGTPEVEEVYGGFTTIAVEGGACFSSGLYEITCELVRWYHA